jgi:hypothetical protein
MGFSQAFAEHADKFGPPAAVVIVDDIAATGRALAGNVATFLETNLDVLQQSGSALFVITLLASVQADKTIRDALAAADGIKADFRTCEILDAGCFAFDSQNNIWASQEEFERAKALCTDIGAKIYPKNPLGFGNQALLMVFPNTVPNNSLPILHSRSKLTSGKQ